MTILLLIRHGENDYVGKRLAGRRPDVHLNDRGRQQAQLLAQVLCHAPIRAIYSSPLDRAIETAEPLARELDLPIQPRDGLMEIDFGGWVGKTIGQMRRTNLWKLVQNHPSQVRFPAGESFSEAQARLSTELTAIAATHQPDQMVACFSHSDAIKLAVAHFIGLPLDKFQRLGVSTASITVLVLPAEGDPHLANLNQVLNFDLRPPQEKPKRRRTPKETPTNP
ncbi:MAG: histidine phosphatase family protein [Anaerolineaceae bacterium]|nr:histidine phosphatase family protein [Anaerolineaceae bacterium]